jgi:hypothetical protein
MCKALETVAPYSVDTWTINGVVMLRNLKLDLGEVRAVAGAALLTYDTLLRISNTPNNRECHQKLERHHGLLVISSPSNALSRNVFRSF